MEDYEDQIKEKMSQISENRNQIIAKTRPERVKGKKKFSKGIILGILIILAICIPAGVLLWGSYKKKHQAQTLLPTATSAPNKFHTAWELHDDGWLYVFQQSEPNDHISTEWQYPAHYSFYGINLRYSYKDAALVTYEHTTDFPSNNYTIRTVENPGVQMLYDKSDAHKRDIDLLNTQILKDGTSVEELLALTEDDIEFEALDEEMFFRLMREALTSDPLPEPTDMKYLEGQPQCMCIEPYFINQYRFQVGLFSPMGYVNEVYIDLLFEDDEEECGYVQLSDLIESGEATPEQEKIYQEILKTTDKIRGVEDIPAAIEDMNCGKVEGVDFNRLYTMLDSMGHYDYSGYYPEPEIIKRETFK